MKTSNRTTEVASGETGGGAAVEGDPNCPTCYICMDGLDEVGKPAVRDCSCRGTAGYAHVSCIVKYAAQKIKEATLVGPTIAVGGVRRDDRSKRRHRSSEGR